MVDFEKTVDRRGTYSVKWDGMPFDKEDLLPMWVADMEFPAPDAVREALKKRIDHPVYGYTEQTREVAAALCGWIERRHGFRADPASVCLCESLMNSTAIAVHALTEPGDRIATLTPVYHPFYDVIENSGRVLARSPLIFQNGAWRMDLEGLERIFMEGCRFMLLCSPHNPTGRVWTRQELSALAQLLLRYDVTVVSDDIHSDIVSPGHPYTPLALADERLRGQILTSYSTSKTFNIAGIKGAGTIIEDPEKRRLFTDWQQRMKLGELSLFSYVSMEAAYTHGDAYCDALCGYIHENALYTKAYADARLPGIRSYVQEGTYLMLWDCSDLGYSGDALVRWFADRAGVVFSGGHQYGEEIAPFVRVNLACPRAMLDQALTRIRAALES